MKKIATILIASIALISCERYTEPGVVDAETPVFFVEGVIHGSTITFDADAGYIAESAFELDSFAVTSYTGSLKSCVTCKPVFQLKWRASDLDEPSLWNTVGGAAPELRQREAQDSIETYIVRLNAMPSQAGGTFSWLIDGQAYDGGEVEVALTRSDDKTFVPVELTAEYPNACKAVIVDTVFLPHHGCNCRITSTQTGADAFSYRALKTASTGVAFDWTFESGAKASSKEVIYAYASIPNDGVEEVRLSTRVNECNAVAHYQQHFPQVANSCAINFEVDITTQTSPPATNDGVDLNRIELFYTTEGRTYRSYPVTQPSTSFITIDEVEVYDDPLDQTEHQEAKVSGRFQCLLVDGVDTLRLDEGRFTLPIGKGADQ